jgi:hypothetical protein
MPRQIRDKEYMMPAACSCGGSGPGAGSASVIVPRRPARTEGKQASDSRPGGVRWKVLRVTGEGLSMEACEVRLRSFTAAGRAQTVQDGTFMAGLGGFHRLPFTSTEITLIAIHSRI